MPCRTIAFLLVIFFTVLGPLPGVAQTPPGASLLWSDVSPESISRGGERVIQAQHYRTLALDLDGMRLVLAGTPLERTPDAFLRTALALPLPEGGFGRFAIVESPCMEPELQARYPDIRTYAGYGLDDLSATVRLDLTPVGFHAFILSTGGTIFIDPFQRGDAEHYQSYYKRDLISDKSLGGCTLLDPDNMAGEIARLAANGELRSGTQLRTYRLALAADGEYTIYQGGTKALALAAMTTTMNRVNGCYEKDLGIHMNMVANEESIIFTDPNTDPYTNTNGSTMLGQNQTTCDNLIGSANYDIGHVLSTGGGGVAYLGVVCRSGQKAGGVTGSSAPVGDGFDIDYVAHEMGHQFGGNHTFNCTSGSCGGGNRNSSTAYEPGSASTIMGYAGICAPGNLQLHSDDYFVWISLQEIIAYSQSGSGNNCPTRTSTGVIEPTITLPAGGFTIPISTPFTLTASATTTGTPTYCWEESDLGPSGGPNAPSGNAPIMRSFDPVTDPGRTFPKLTDLINNVHTIGELLPSYARNLSFRLTVRDTQAGGVGVSYSAPLTFAVAAVGPFLVTSPNTAVVWDAGSQQTVTWNVSGTSASPINCQTVNIRLSTDGGVTFPTVLLAGTPNDGSEIVTLPAVASTAARVKVEAANNIFFDISNVNFTILQVPTGACCDPGTGGCTLVLLTDCTSPLTWNGAAGCEPNPCPQVGACCSALGACGLSLQADCASPGVWHPEWASCSPNLCPQPGACCDPSSGACALVLPAACSAPLTWSGAESCEPNPCPQPQPTGVCCDPAGGPCAVTTEGGCVAPGEWHGDWTTCSPDMCPASSVPQIALGIGEGFVGAVPNPFSSSTALWYRMSAPAHVRLVILDAAGRRLASLDAGTMSAGTHSVSWNGRGVGGNPAAPGVYFAQLTAGGRSWTRTLIRIR